jgi:hypothetical protein
MCGHLPVDVSPWVAPTRYGPNDLAVGIYTGEDIVLTRGLAARDTWLNAVPHVALYTVTDVPAAPTVGVAPDRPELAGQKGAHLAQLAGLADLHRRFPRCSWYYIVGCDTYVKVGSTA